MKKDQKFFVCEHCGNLVGMIRNAGVKIICCGEPMKELVANTVEASSEKHLPVVSVEGNIVTVSVGSVTHPMQEEHSIEWIYLETDQGGQRKALHSGQEPVVKFALTEEKPLSAFAYCNLHGLWRTEIK